MLYQVTVELLFLVLLSMVSVSFNSCTLVYNSHSEDNCIMGLVEMTRQESKHFISLRTTGFVFLL